MSFSFFLKFQHQIMIFWNVKLILNKMEQVWCRCTLSFQFITHILVGQILLPPRGVQVKPEISYNTNFHPQCHFQSSTHAQGSHAILCFGAFSDNLITDFEFYTYFMQLWIGVRSQYVFWSIWGQQCKTISHKLCLLVIYFLFYLFDSLDDSILYFQSSNSPNHIFRFQ